MDIDTGVALIELEEVKEYLRIPNATDTDDEILQALINATGSWVANFLGRKLVRTTYTEYYDGDGSRDLLLRNLPIVSVTSIHIDELRTFDATSLVDSSDYIVKKQQGIVQAFNLLGNWTSGDANIKVIYIAGYTIAFSGGTMPHPVRLAVKRIIDRQYRHGYSSRKLDTSSESSQGMNTVFSTDAIPKDVVAMLEPYRVLVGSPQFAYAD